MRFISGKDIKTISNRFNTAIYSVNLQWFNDALNGVNRDDCRVLLTANDGNHYAIIETSDSAFMLVALTDNCDGTGDIVALSKHDSYQSAAHEMILISACDYGF